MKPCPQCGIHPEVELVGRQLVIYCPSCAHSGDGAVHIGCYVDDDDGSTAATFALAAWNRLSLQEAA